MSDQDEVGLDKYVQPNCNCNRDVTAGVAHLDRSRDFCGTGASDRLQVRQQLHRELFII